MLNINYTNNKLLNKCMRNDKFCSLLEVEFFLRKATNIKKALGLARNLNYISHKNKSGQL